MKTNIHPTKNGVYYNKLHFLFFRPNGGRRLEREPAPPPQNYQLTGTPYRPATATVDPANLLGFDPAIDPAIRPVLFSFLPTPAIEPVIRPALFLFLPTQSKATATIPALSLFFPTPHRPSNFTRFATGTDQHRNGTCFVFIPANPAKAPALFLLPRTQ
jgi:hypothetical protein